MTTTLVAVLAPAREAVPWWAAVRPRTASAQPLPRQGIERRMIQRMTRSNSRPSAPMMMIVIQIIS